jgi:hypothetical protein
MEDKDIIIPDSKDDYIEAEIVNDSFQSKGKRKISFLEKIRIKFGKAVLILTLPIGLILIIVGAILTSTFIGSIIGIPLIILGFIIVILSFIFFRFISGK